MKKNVRNICIGIVFFIMIFILLLSCQMIKLPNNLDELWNYNTARCIKNGLIPYKDISMITTPLLPFKMNPLSSTFKKRLGNGS